MAGHPRRRPPAARGARVRARARTLGLVLVWGLVGTGLLAALVVALARVVRGDGLGHRPPPLSRRDWAADSTLEVRSSVRIGL